MKILLIGPAFFNYTNALKQAFANLENDVECYILQDNWINTSIGRIYHRCNMLYYAMKRKKEVTGIHTKKVIAFNDEMILKVYDKFKPDVLISYAGYILSDKVLKSMVYCKKAIWIYDTYERLSNNVIKTIPFYDKIFTFEKNDLGKYEAFGKKAFFLPLCADETTYYPKENEKTIDVSFVGELTRERLDLFRKIHHSMPGIKMQIYGVYVGKYDIPGKILRKMHSEGDIFKNQGLPPHLVNNLYSKSKICINLHRSQSKYGANIRLYELMAAGAFQIVNKNPYITENFDGCLKTFDDYNELIELIDYYVKNDEERKRISINGYQKAVNSELFIHRAKTILDIVC